MRFFRCAAQIARVVVIIVAAWGAFPAIFVVRCGTAELDLGSLRQPFGVSELLLSRHSIHSPEKHNNKQGKMLTIYATLRVSKSQISYLKP
jgi:hypothetical protein